MAGISTSASSMLALQQDIGQMICHCPLRSIVNWHGHGYNAQASTGVHAIATGTFAKHCCLSFPGQLDPIIQKHLDRMDTITSSCDKTHDLLRVAKIMQKP